MKVTVDPDVCEAHGDCVLTAPEVFELGDDDRVVTVLQPEPAEELRDQVRFAEQTCPTGAITISD